ncbi:hypothetical protein PanWU01x14_360660, partial [Parasponia andersonii]
MNPSSREMGAVVGPVPKSYATSTAEWVNRSQKGSTVRQGLAHYRLWIVSAQSGPYFDSWGVESPKVFHLNTIALTSTAGGSEAPRIQAVGGGRNQATAIQRRSQKSRPVTSEKDFEEK